MPTQRLYLDEPQRKTALATVTGHAAGGFLLDRTVFHASDKAYHHVQPEDRGHLLAEGHKLKVPRVFLDEAGRIIHRTTGPLPAVGAKAQLHLDADRRDHQARAHLAMHILAAAVIDHRGSHLEAPRIVGGGSIRLHVTFREAPAKVIPEVLTTARRQIARQDAVEIQWAPRDMAAKLVTHHVLPLADIAPREPTLRLASCAGITLPCDAPLPDHVHRIGTITPDQFSPTREGVRWGVRVVA